LQYKIPQDVQLEDKIIGPITMKQLGICAIGGTIDYGLYMSLSKTYYWEVWILPVAFIALLTIAIAFIKIINLTFTKFVLLLVEYNVKPKKRFWVKGEGIIYPSLIQPTNKDKEKIENKINKKIKKDKTNLDSINKISKILDSYSKK